MGNYAATLKRTASTSASVGSINAPASGMRIAKLYDITFSSDAAVNDTCFSHVLQRCTTTGTRTALTPRPLNPQDAASATVAGHTHTAEPTYTASEELFEVAVNQRATFRWVGREGSELVIPATANNGIGFQTPSPTPAAAVKIHVLFSE